MNKDERLKDFETKLRQLLRNSLTDGVTPDELCEIAEHTLEQDWFEEL